MDSWAFQTFLLTLVVSVGEEGARVDLQLQQFSDGQPHVQGQLAALHEQALGYTNFTLGQCVQQWGIVSGAGLAVTATPFSLGPLQTVLLTAFRHRPILKFPCSSRISLYIDTLSVFQNLGVIFLRSKQIIIH